jgi:hypothetical protein
MDAPECFTKETSDFNADTNWKELHCKPDLRQHLRQEQQQLCAYCEGKLEDNNSHIEHIEPQEKNPQRRIIIISLYPVMVVRLVARITKKIVMTN